MRSRFNVAQRGVLLVGVLLGGALLTAVVAASVRRAEEPDEDADVLDALDGPRALPATTAQALDPEGFRCNTAKRLVEVESVIHSAVAASATERAEKVEAARARIGLETEPKDRRWYLGLLHEGLGEAVATRYYAAAARLGHQNAEHRLVALLEHPTCAMRSRAAHTLADLRLVRETEALKLLAGKGGADDELAFFGFGCDSKAAATRALERLKN